LSVRNSSIDSTSRAIASSGTSASAVEIRAPATPSQLWMHA